MLSSFHIEVSAEPFAVASGRFADIYRMPQSKTELELTKNDTTAARESSIIAKQSEQVAVRSLPPCWTLKRTRRRNKGIGCDFRTLLQTRWKHNWRLLDGSASSCLPRASSNRWEKLQLNMKFNNSASLSKISSLLVSSSSNQHGTTPQPPQRNR